MKHVDDQEQDPAITVRVPADWIERAAALAEAMAGYEEVRKYGKPTRSMVARMSMIGGLEALERKYVKKGRAKK